MTEFDVGEVLMVSTGLEYVYKQRVYEVRMQGVIVAPVRMYTGGYYGLVVVPPRP